MTSVDRFEVGRWNSDLQAVSGLMEAGSSLIHEVKARNSGPKTGV